MGKKAKKGKAKEEEPPPEEPSEFDTMTEEELKSALADLKTKYEKARADRNYVQVERDSVQTFYDISKKDVQKCDLEIELKTKDFESSQKSHAVELRVYEQKIKHLQFEHGLTMKNSNQDGAQFIEEEQSNHSDRNENIVQAKSQIRSQISENAAQYSEIIDELAETHRKNLAKMEENFEENLESLRRTYERNYEEMRRNLELKKKVEIHEIEERKNAHINSLVRNFENSFSQTKNYYNKITCDNLNLIKLLKEEIAGIKSKALENQKLTLEMAQENKNLSEPLREAIKEAEQLKHQLKGYDKDKTSLKYTIARKGLLEKEAVKARNDLKSLQAQYQCLEYERNKLYDTFEESIKEVQRKSEYKNVSMEQRLIQLEHQQEQKSALQSEIASSANEALLNQVKQKLEDEVDQRNQLIEEMNYNLSYICKTHNDTLRSLRDKFVELGVPEDDLDTIKFMDANSSSMAAGLLG